METAARRARLQVRKKPYWVPAGGPRDGVSLGYRRTIKGPGRWIARLRTAGGWSEAVIGVPGPAMEFAEARARALAWAAELRAAAATPLTVADAIAAYEAARGRKDWQLPHLSRAPLAEMPLGAVQVEDLRTFVQGLRLGPARRARVLASCRALFRGAYRRAGLPEPTGWPQTVTTGLAAPPAPPPKQQTRADVLDDEAIARLLAAARDPTMRRAIILLAATGARMGQLFKMTGKDVEPGLLWVPCSAKGSSLTRQTAKPGHVRCPVGTSVSTAVETEGPLIPLTPVMFYRAFRKLCVAAKVSATAYHFRDHSIIRMLKAGIDISSVARRHDTSPAMIQRSYARHLLSGQDERLAQAAWSP